jgi:hypothetical protein
MNQIRLTPENAAQYIGREIVFKTRGKQITKKILGVSKTGKSIQIDHPDLNNSLEIVSRIVFINSPNMKK